MLSEDQFLPGTENMREAEPYEQTETQFQNRPDVFVHGRYVDTRRHNDVLPNYERGEFPEPWQRGDGFHAGTQRAAEERLHSLGAPYKDTEPRFYHGRVDPTKMRNTPETGAWESDPDDLQSYVGNTGRRQDFGEMWDPEDRNIYYRNDYEDKGSTSVLLPMEYTKGTREHPSPKNFTSWRDEVGSALHRGARVPGHIRGAFEASGGSEGSMAHVDTRFGTPGDAYQTRDTPIQPSWDLKDKFQLKNGTKGLNT